MDTVHERGEVVVQAGSFRHSGDELAGLEFSNLHVFVDNLILALVAQTAQELVALYVCFDDLTICAEKLDLPEFIED